MVHPLTRPAAVRWVLLCALTFGIIGMHHLVLGGAEHEGMAGPMTGAYGVLGEVPSPLVAAAGESAPRSRLAPAAPSGCDHGMLHLCQAIVGAAGTLLLAWLLVAVALELLPLPGAARTRSAGRDPPRPRRPAELLASLCVLRL